MSQNLRYQNIFNEIKKCKPKKILEIGTWNGKHAVKMIKTAQQYSNYVTYYGFDLWEHFDYKLREKEYCPKVPARRFDVQKLLDGTNCKYYLFQGDTKITLNKKVLLNIGYVDFVWLDGGHSLKTIESDWRGIKQLLHTKSVVLLDDYYIGEIGKQYGCRTLIHSLDEDIYNIEYLQPIDDCNGGTQIVKINLREY